MDTKESASGSSDDKNKAENISEAKVDVMFQQAKDNAAEFQRQNSDPQIETAVEKALNEKESGTDSVKPELTNAQKELKEGELYFFDPDKKAPGHGKILNGAARTSVLDKQQRDFNERKAEQEPKNAINAEEKILANAWEEAVEPTSGITEKLQEPTGFETQRLDVIEKSKKADALENKYREEYEAHILKQSSGWRYFANMPKRMWGLDPSLPQELMVLRAQSSVAREDYKWASRRLRDSKPTKENSTENKVATKIYQGEVRRRHEAMLAYHLTVGVQQKRLEAQQKAVMEAWESGRVVRPTAEVVGKVVRQIPKHPYVAGSLVLGAAILAPAAVGIVAAGMGVRYGVGKVLDKTYVKSAKPKLMDARKRAGENLFGRNFSDTDVELGQLTFLEQKREARAKTISRVAGVATGIGLGTAVYGGSSVTPDQPPAVDVHPDVPPTGGEGITPEPPVHGDITQPAEPVNPPQEHLPEHPADTDDNLEHQEDVTEGEVDEDVPDEVAVPVVEARYYTVPKNGNAWNGMEGSGPDAHPTGGMSEVVKDMSLQQRRYWLDKLMDYYDQHPKEAVDVGAVKSHGVIDKVYPGEKLNITMMDEKLMELMHQNSAGDIPVPTSRPEIVELPNDAPIPEPRPEVGDLPQEAPIPESGQNAVVDTTPESTLNPDIDPKGEIDSLPDNSQMVREASLTTPAPANLASQNLEDYIHSIEQPKVGVIDKLFFGGGPDISGTFDKITDLNFEQIKEFAGRDMGEVTSELGVTEKGYEAWMSELQKAVTQNAPLSDSETVGQYFTRVNSPQVTA